LQRETQSVCLTLGIRTPPTPQRPPSSPERPREDLTTLPDAAEQRSPAPLLAGIVTSLRANGPGRQQATTSPTAQSIPICRQGIHLPERPRLRGNFNRHRRQSYRGKQPYHTGQPHQGRHYHEAKETPLCRESATSGVRGGGRRTPRGRGGGGQHARSLHERICF